MQSMQADMTSVTFVEISKYSDTDRANTEADECDLPSLTPELQDKKRAAFDAISKDSGTETTSVEAVDSDGRVLDAQLPDRQCATLSYADGSAPGAVVRNEEPLPDGWWFIPPNLSLEQYLAAGGASDTTRTKTQKGKKKRKANTGATNASDSTVPQADLLQGTASVTHADDDTAPQADLPQETAENAECEQKIPLTTVAPNLETAGTVIASLLERFPQEFANFNAKVQEFYDGNVPNGNAKGLKQDIRWMINDLLSKQLPRSELYIVGSTVNGCGSANSNLDMCLVAEDADGGHPSDKQYVVDTLSVVKRILISDYRKRFRNVKLVPHATYPYHTSGTRKSQNKKTLGELLLGFFDYFAHFDFSAYGISTVEGCPMERERFPTAMQKYSIIVMDPFEPVNAARTVFKKSWPFVLDAFRSFLLDVFGESVLHPLCDLPSDAGDPEPAHDDDRQDAERCVTSDQGAAESEVVMESHDHSDVCADESETTAHQENVDYCGKSNQSIDGPQTVMESHDHRDICANESEMIAHQENVELSNDGGELEPAEEADDQQEAEQCVKSDLTIVESQVSEESPHHSDVCADECEMTAHHGNAELPNDSGEPETAQKACYQQEAELCVKPDLGIVVANETHHPSTVRANGSETIVHKANTGGEEEWAPANLAGHASSGQQQSHGALTGNTKESLPSQPAAVRPKEVRRSRLSKLRTHCWCL